MRLVITLGDVLTLAVIATLLLAVAAYKLRAKFKRLFKAD